MLTDEQRFILKQQHAMFLGRFQALATLVGEQVHPVLEAAPRSSHLDATVYGLHLRAFAWSHSIKRLDDVFDFQAHSAGCRSLFEITIDLVLLTRGGEPVEKLLEWERVARYESAQHATNATGGNAAVVRAAAQFVKENASAVALARAKFWPTRKKKGPMRWTGAGLFADAIRADALLPLRLGDLARDHYERLCWGTHGSGLILVRNISEEFFPGISIVAVHESFNLLAHVCRLTLEHFKLFDDSWAGRIQAAKDRGMLRGLQKSVDGIAALEGES